MLMINWSSFCISSVKGFKWLFSCVSLQVRSSHVSPLCATSLFLILKVFGLSHFSNVPSTHCDKNPLWTLLVNQGLSYDVTSYPSSCQVAEIHPDCSSQDTYTLHFLTHSSLGAIQILQSSEWACFSTEERDRRKNPCRHWENMRRGLNQNTTESPFETLKPVTDHIFPVFCLALKVRALNSLF